jgi:GT2 family glycosyltransferase
MRNSGVSIIIPTYRQKYLKDALDSLSGQTNDHFEVVVVENGCRHSDTLALTKHYEAYLDVQYHFEPRQGTNRAYNLGARLAKNDIIALIDDDVVPSPQWVDAVLKAHSEYPEAGVIGGKVELRFLEERPAWCIGNFARMLAAVDYGPDPCELSGFNPHEPSYLVSANMSFRRMIFEIVGGFCEDPDPGYNGEFTFTEEAKRYGEPGLLYDPSILVVHQIPPERTTLPYMLRRAYAQGASDVALHKLLSPDCTRRDMLTMWEKHLYCHMNGYEEMVKDRQSLPEPDKDVFTEYFLAHRLAYLSGVGDAIRDEVDYTRFQEVQARFPKV